MKINCKIAQIQETFENKGSKRCLDDVVLKTVSIPVGKQLLNHCDTILTYNLLILVVTNKNVEYFGFPKSVEFAQKWAIAAGRDDLLDKSLNNIIKYYLCSSHFTDDCFTDQSRAHLKKQSRPKVIVPIPSIFLNNITEFIPDSVKRIFSTIDLPAKRKVSDITIEEVETEYDDQSHKASDQVLI